ncbi:MAG TPA: proton-conducting transporter membrane subunit [Candidatus Eisenbacteria bacterium]
MPEPALALFVLLLAVPLAGAVVAGLSRGRAADAVALVATLATAGVAGVLVSRHGIAGVAIPLGGLPWLDRAAGHPVALFGFALDPLASIVLLAAVILGFVCVLYSTAYVSGENRETPATGDRRAYWSWMLLFVMAMAGLVTSATLVQMFVFWEITTVCSWALIGTYDREPGAIAAAQKALLMTAGGGFALLATILVLLALTHSAGFDAISRLPAGARGVGVLLWVLLLAGAWAKSGQVPFHTWLPSAMVAPTPVSAYLHAASMVNAGVYLVLRMALANAPVPVHVALASGTPPGSWPVPALPSALPWVIGAMAVLTLVVAVAQFFYQDDLKRLLALSTISHLALVMLGAALVLAGSVRAAQGASLHILAHGVGKALLFLSVGALSYAAGTRHVRDLSGVLRHAPVASAGFLIGALTVTGVPPFAGFWSKLLLVTGAVSLGGIGVGAGALIVLESVIAFAWFLWVGQRVFLGRPSAAASMMSAGAPAMDAALVVLIVLCLAITAVAAPLAAAVAPGHFGG